MEAVIVRGLTYRYQSEGPSVLKKISFEAAQGEIVAVTGLSGCGKSTLSFCLGGIIPHCQGGVMTGEVLINGKNTRELRMALLAFEVGLVFQDPDTQLFSPTVEEEIAFAPENMCLSPQHIRERVDNIIDLLGITALKEANPYHLSGGEKHLVALAAVLTLDPPVLVLDEVMSQLDPEGKKRVAVVLGKLRTQGKTIITIEHDLETVALADRLMVLDDGALVRFDRTETVLADRDFLSAGRLIYDHVHF
jgi:energy-coupling factor transport system ATP-binding protein